LHSKLSRSRWQAVVVAGGDVTGALALLAHFEGCSWLRVGEDLNYINDRKARGNIHSRMSARGALPACDKSIDRMQASAVLWALLPGGACSAAAPEGWGLTLTNAPRWPSCWLLRRALPLGGCGAPEQRCVAGVRRRPAIDNAAAGHCGPGEPEAAACGRDSLGGRLGCFCVAGACKAF
jgi:hypothetical protein